MTGRSNTSQTQTVIKAFRAHPPDRKELGCVSDERHGNSRGCAKKKDIWIFSFRMQ
jgi:hypothetical protein